MALVKKGKPKKNSVATDDALARRLEQHGEAFLASFDTGRPKKRQRLDSETDNKPDAEIKGTNSLWEDILGPLNQPQEKAPTAPGRPGPKVVDATGYGSRPITEPTEKKAKFLFLSGKVTDLNKADQPPPQFRRKRPPPRQPSLMESVAQEVEALGASTLTGKAKKHHEALMLAKLGAKMPKRATVPMVEHMRHLAKVEKKEARLREEEGAMGWRGKSQVGSKETKVAKKGAKSRDRGLNPLGMAGTYVKGTLHVRQDLIQSVGKKKKKK